MLAATPAIPTIPYVWLAVLAVLAVIGYGVDLRARWKSPFPKALHCFPMAGLSGGITICLVLSLMTLAVVFEALPIVPAFAVMFGVPILLGGLGEALYERRVRQAALRT